MFGKVNSGKRNTNEKKINKKDGENKEYVQWASVVGCNVLSNKLTTQLSRNQQNVDKILNVKNIENIISNMWHSGDKGPIWSVLETEILKKICGIVKKLKKWFPHFGMFGHQNHPYVDRILKKSLQGSIHPQFYMAIKGLFGRFLLQLCTESVKRCKNKFPTLRR